MDLQHTPRTYEDRDDPIRYSVKPVSIFLKPVYGHICTECGMFYVPGEDAVCPTKLAAWVKEL